MCVGVYWAERGRLGEGVGPTACEKLGSRFSIWVQSIVKFARYIDGPHPK
jgi:hypothetical protein